MSDPFSLLKVGVPSYRGNEIDSIEFLLGKDKEQREQAEQQIGCVRKRRKRKQCPLLAILGAKSETGTITTQRSG